MKTNHFCIFFFKKKNHRHSNTLGKVLDITCSLSGMFVKKLRDNCIMFLFDLISLNLHCCKSVLPPDLVVYSFDTQKPKMHGRNTTDRVPAILCVCTVLFCHPNLPVHRCNVPVLHAPLIFVLTLGVGKESSATVSLVIVWDW